MVCDTHMEGLWQTTGVILLLRSLHDLSSAMKEIEKTLLYTHGSNTLCIFVEKAGIFPGW